MIPCVHRAREIAVVGVAATLLAGCGGSARSNQIGAYVNSVCQANITLGLDLSQRAAKFETELAAAGSRVSAAQFRSLSGVYVADVIHDIDQTVARLQAAGVPHVRDGANIARTLQSLFEPARTDFQMAQAKFERLTAHESRAKFANALVQIGASLHGSMSAVVAGISKPRIPAVVAAAPSTSACQAMWAPPDA